MRKAAVAGYFYPQSREELESLIARLFEDKRGAGLPKPKDAFDGKLVGVVVPHAGYIYSGYTATFSYKAIAEHGNPKRFVIIGPNHTGYGKPLAVGNEDWETPLGIARIDEELATHIVENSNAEWDNLAHLMEHSVEVQLPFLQYLFGDDFTFVPICMGEQTLENAKSIANALASYKKDFVLIASSDLNHYDEHRTTYEKDMIAIKEILGMNPKAFYKALGDYNITACGYGCIATLMFLASLKNAKPRLLNHTTSGEISGDMMRTVGYASIAFEV